MQEMESKAAEVDKAEAALENPSTVITDTYTESPSTLEIPATSSSVVGMPSTTTPMLESLQIPSSPNNPSDIETSSINDSALGEMQSEGLVTPSAVISASSSVPKVGPILSAVDKFNLKATSVTSTSVPETWSAGGAGQTPQTPS